MGALLLILMIGGFALFVAASRRGRALRAARAATVRFVVDARGIERDLADGRHEAVAWDEVRRVDVVTLPRGPWEGRLRIVVHGDGATTGCIVPIDVAEAGGLLGGLGKLPGFDHRALQAAIAAESTGTTTIWRRHGDLTDRSS
ncbi:MAG: hypothetical protein ABIV94_07725 [Acidimicrobiales bacterium]